MKLRCYLCGEIEWESSLPPDAHLLAPEHVALRTFEDHLRAVTHRVPLTPESAVTMTAV